MRIIKWDEIGQRLYETGNDRGVIYLQKDGSYKDGAAWNGLVNVTETPSGAEDNAKYADNIKYLNIKSAEDFGGTIECYTYPPEFKACNGETEIHPGVTIGQQARATFGFCYRSIEGNDTQGEAYGYKLHLWYNCTANPSERQYQSVNESPDALTFSYEISTTPVPVEGYKPTALLTISSVTANKKALAELEAILYGDDEEQESPRMPLPDEIFKIFEDAIAADEEQETP